MASYSTVRKFLIDYCIEHQIGTEQVDLFPKKWEKYGDFVLFDRRLLSSPVWLHQSSAFWTHLSSVLKCSRVAVKGEITSNDYRSPKVRFILGCDPWINHTDNSIKYVWNVNENMFSAGNAPERHRIAKLNCENQVIVDMHAGIGYFTLPYLVHAKAKLVYALEWNPTAVVSLKRALKLNKVEDRCLVYEGDNKLKCPSDVADRVNLGLIPSSEDAWTTACLALKPSGGVLVIHGNVETMKNYECCSGCKTDVDRGGFKWKHESWFLWSCHVLHSIADLMEKARSCRYEVTLESLHFVKSYAPHVDHLVLDVRVTSSAIES